LNGVDIHEETNTAMSPAFLMQQMEWREAIGEAKVAKDAPELEHLSGQLRAEIQAQQHQLADLLDKDKNYPKAAEIVRELKFMEKLREEINYALEALDA
jgi:molecular chaperone HscB